MSCCSRNFDDGFLGFTKNISGQYRLLFSEIFSERKGLLFSAVEWLLSGTPFSLYLHLGDGLCVHRCRPKPDPPPATSALQTDLDSLQCHYELSGQQPHLLCLLSSVTALNILGPHWTIWEECELERWLFWSFGGNCQSLGQVAGGVTKTLRGVRGSPGWLYSIVPSLGANS